MDLPNFHTKQQYIELYGMDPYTHEKKGNATKTEQGKAVGNGVSTAVTRQEPEVGATEVGDADPAKEGDFPVIDIMDAVGLEASSSDNTDEDEFPVMDTIDAEGLGASSADNTDVGPLPEAIQELIDHQ